MDSSQLSLAISHQESNASWHYAYLNVGNKTRLRSVLRDRRLFNLSEFSFYALRILTVVLASSLPGQSAKLAFDRHNGRRHLTTRKSTCDVQLLRFPTCAATFLPFTNTPCDAGANSSSLHGIRHDFWRARRWIEHLQRGSIRCPASRRSPLARTRTRCALEWHT